MFINYPVDPERVGDYGDLIPECYHDRLRRKEITAVATIENFSDASDKDVPVGVIILDSQEGWVKILWYAMTPDYDTPDYARDLVMERVYDAYTGGSAKGIFAELPVSDRKDELLEIFRLAGFDVTFSESRVLSFQLKDLKELSKLKSTRDFISLGEASSQTRRLLSNLIANDRRAVPVEVPVIWENYNRTLSLIHMKQDKPVGVMLVSVVNKSIRVDLAYEHSPKGFITLLSAVIERAKAILPPETEIVVPVVETRLIGFLKMIAPGVTGDEVMKAYRPFKRQRSEDYFADFSEEESEEGDDGDGVTADEEANGGGETAMAE